MTTEHIPLRQWLARVGLIGLISLHLQGFGASADGSRDGSGSPNTAKLQAVAQRVPWTNSHVHGSPEPPAPYAAKRVFPQLRFKDPVDMCAAPGQDRLFVAEQAGKVFSFKNSAESVRPDLFLDLASAVPGVTALYGLAFHPGFVTNHFVYVCYVLKDGLEDGSRVSRFTVKAGDPPLVDTASEKILITWLAGGHNGGCIKFGSDGDLYISTGDGAGPNPPDPLRTGQDLGDLLSSILRIDVDHPEQGKAYRVPTDNPFLNTPGARPEIWAYGLRNPWRMSFDRKTGALWVGDVGWELWEMVYKIERGGNYGWSIVEGPQSIHPDWKRGPTPVLPPVKAHPHTEAASITGGCVYYGAHLPALVGAYIYGDWVTGKIWALRSDQGKLASVDELVDTPLQIVCFGEDNSGELFVVDYGGGIYQLEPNLAPSDQAAFPRRLSETGLFTSVPRHELAPGVAPFDVNAEMWADHASAERFVAFPGDSFIQTGASNVWLFQSKNEWRYPSNAVLAKTLSLELTSGQTQTVRRVETQLLHFDGLDWHGYSYRWNPEQTDATLVDGAGDEMTLDISDPQAPEGHRQQLWRFHSRAECLRCHNPWANFALAFTGSQLNREREGRRSLPGSIEPSNQLRWFAQAHYFDQPLDERARPKLTDPYSPTAPISERARSWLQVNCAHCHREGAGGAVVSHFDYETSLREMKAIGQIPSQGTLGLNGAHVISPGDPCSSVLYFRISTSGQGRMPLIGSTQVDTRGAQLIHDWIAQLPDPAVTGTSSQAKRAPLEEDQAAQASSSTPIQTETVNRLLATPNGALALVSALNQHPEHPCPTELANQAAQHPNSLVRGLFERFLPDRLRPKKLGLNFRPEQILSLSGDAMQGRAVFFREGMACSQCHRVDGQGRDFGPDLSQIGTKYPRAEILGQILFPSQRIDPAFTSYEVETLDDRSYSGFVVKRTSEEVWVKQADFTEVHLPAAKIKAVRPLQLSAMPEGLLQNLTAQDAADLIEFLASHH